MSLEWIFDPAPPSGARRGGLANAQVFDATLDSFVREVLQNARDQRLGGDPVHVRFTLKEISGPELDAFLAALQWPELRDHVEAAANPALVTIGPRLREGLGEIAEGRLRILRIEDADTHGLTGGEEDDSNFAALCRHELITSADRRASGGSFGLGKSVLWRFSGLSTVLFSSSPNDSQDFRFIGRTVLPAHEAAGGNWEGSGWYGVPDPEAARAVSVFGDPAHAVADETYIDRAWDATGTSILIVGFDEPGREVEQDVADLCDDMVTSATRWFWPALHADELTIQVAGWEDEERVFFRSAEAVTPETLPFVHAQQEPAAVSETAEEPGDVLAYEIPVTIPGQKSGRFDHPRQGTEAFVSLRIRLAESGEGEHRNTVALQRGTGMVVRYHDVRTPAGADQAFHAVLLAGGAHGNEASDEALEEFLRAAEPPAHSEWTSRTERIKAEYGHGFRKALDGLFAQIESAIRELTREEVTESDEGPDALKRLFPLPGSGAPVREETFRLADAGAALEARTWEFNGRFIRKPVDDADRRLDWGFDIALYLDQEGSGASTARGERVPIRDLHVSEGAAFDAVDADGSVRVNVSAGASEVSFSGSSTELAELPSRDLRRVRLGLDLRGRKAGPS